MAVYEPVCISNLHENLIHEIIHLGQPLEFSTKHKTINILSSFLSKLLLFVQRIFRKICDVLRL